MRSLMLVALIMGLLLSVSQAQPFGASVQGQECAVIVVNALAVDVEIGINIGGETVSGLAPGECELINVPCSPRSGGGGGAAFATQAAQEGPSIEITGEGLDISTSVPLDVPQETQATAFAIQGGGGRPSRPRYVHYLVLSHNIETSWPPDNVIGTFTFSYEGTELTLALIYERVRLPAPLDDDEVGLAFWHTAAGAPFPLRIQIRGIEEALSGSKRQPPDEGEEVPPSELQPTEGQPPTELLPPTEGQPPTEDGEEPPTTEDGEEPPTTEDGEEQPPEDDEGAGRPTTPPPPPTPTEDIILDPFEREDWHFFNIPSAEQQQTGIAQLAAVDDGVDVLIQPASEQQVEGAALAQTAAAGGPFFEQDIEELLRESGGQLLTAFIVTNPPELGPGLEPRLYFTSCATEAQGGNEGISIVITPA